MTFALGESVETEIREISTGERAGGLLSDRLLASLPETVCGGPRGAEGGRGNEGDRCGMMEAGSSEPLGCPHSAALKAREQGDMSFSGVEMQHCPWPHSWHSPG